jgi:hypothetical protein
MTKTKTIRVPETVVQEISTTAEMLGCTPAQLLELAWKAYRASPEFAEDLTFTQKTFATGDPDVIMARLQERRRQRTRRRGQADNEVRHPESRAATIPKE